MNVVDCNIVLPSNKMARISKMQLTVAVAAATVLSVAAYKKTQIMTETVTTVSNDSALKTAPQPVVVVEQKIMPDPLWSEEEVQAIAKTLAGECYDDKEHDKRLVCEVILNRVSNDQWGDTVLAVLEQDGQFLGYWAQSRQISENDLEVAKEALTDWYTNDCQALSDYLYFSAGDNRENVFRSEF